MSPEAYHGMAGGRFMSSLPNRWWSPQGHATAPHVSPSSRVSAAAAPWAPFDGTNGTRFPAPERGNPPVLSLKSRALTLTRALLPTQRAVLVRALALDVLALGSPYAPTSAEEEQVAATLAHPSFSLLWPEALGYLRIYRPTLLGRLVLYAYLLERVAGETLSAWPAEPIERTGRTGRTDRRARRWGRGR
jgi:hypothetical protein